VSASALARTRVSPQPVDLADFHQDRYLDRTEDPELRKVSGRWLIDRGFIGCRGVELLPFGELPE